MLRISVFCMSPPFSFFMNKLIFVGECVVDETLFPGSIRNKMLVPFHQLKKGSTLALSIQGCTVFSGSHQVII